MPRRVLALSLLVAGCASSAPTALPSDSGSFASARSLVEAIRARHGATWYRTVTFVQETVTYPPEGERVQTWYEAASVPGRLRIDVAPLGAGDTYLFTSDSTFVARGGAAGGQVRGRAGGNPLLTLGFDVVRIPATEALRAMAALGIDTTAVREDVWDGRPAVVVGAPDEAAPQVWFDRERLVFVRLVERDGERRSETRFREYERAGGGWIAPLVEFTTDGVLVQLERYRAIKTDVALPAGTFDTAAPARVAWWPAAGYDGTE